MTINVIKLIHEKSHKNVGHQLLIDYQLINIDYY